MAIVGTDKATDAMLYEGLNKSQLEVAFRMDHRTITEKLHGVAPSGKRNGVGIWKIDEVAPYLVKPIYDIETYIKRMNHNELPKHLTKEFWAGQRSRQAFERDAGQLWPTDKVMEEVGELFKTIKLQVLLTKDAVSSTTELTERQRQIVDELMDSMLADLQKRVVEKFSFEEKNGPNVHANQIEDDDDDL